MNAQEKRYRIVRPQGEGKVFFNCQCGAMLLRMEKANNDIRLRQRSVDNWNSYPEIREEVLIRTIENFDGRELTSIEEVKAIIEDIGPEGMKRLYALLDMTPVCLRGRCPQCNKRHDITVENIGEADGNSEISADFYSWLIEQMGPATPRAVSTKRPSHSPSKQPGWQRSSTGWKPTT